MNTDFNMPLKARTARGVCLFFLQRLALLLAVACAAASPATAQSVARGQVLYATHCTSCHSINTNNTGPMHLGIVGRKAGSVEGFDYSPALRHSKLIWTRANLLAWLQDPEALIPGQGMDFNLPVARDREDVVAYLATLTQPAK